MIGIELGMAPMQDMRVSPALVAASEMLQLPSLALECLVDEAVESNPALERLDAVECPVCEGSWQSRCPVCASACSPAGAHRAQVGLPVEIDVAAPRTDAHALLEDVRLVLDERDVPVAEYLVASLDGHGFLDQEPADVAATLGTDEPTVARVLAAIRQTGPPGVTAGSVGECLILQLDVLTAVDDDVRAVARAVVEHHLPALAKGHLASIARAIGVDRARVLQALDLIREELRPYPAFDGTGTSPNGHVVPDLVVRERRDAPGELEVELVEPLRVRVGIDPRYLRPSACSARERSHMRTCVLEARSFLARLTDRWDTLRRVAECAVERQKGFLRNGPAALLPLTRAEVAQALGMHESTVSRAVGGRYMVVPSQRVVPLAALFSASGGLGEELRRIVSSEERPLSDEELAERLRAHGYPVARRTVTKYRGLLGIPAASQR